MTATVRPTSRADIGLVVNVLAEAFYDDPLFTWMLPDDRTRRWRSRGVFGTAIRLEALPHGTVDVGWESGRIAGAAIWFPPGTWPSPTRTQLRTLPHYVRALGRRFGPASELVGAFARVHPTTPNWYLYAIGVDPARQGRCKTSRRSRPAPPWSRRCSGNKRAPALPSCSMRGTAIS